MMFSTVFNSFRLCNPMHPQFCFFKLNSTFSNCVYFITILAYTFSFQILKRVNSSPQRNNSLQVFTIFALFTYGVLAAPKPEAKAEAKAGVLAAAPLVAAPALAPAVVTAQSSQAILRTYSALAAPYVAAPYAAAAPLVSAPLVSSYPYVSNYAAPYLAPQYFI